MTKPQQEGSPDKDAKANPGAGVAMKADEDHPIITRYTEASSPTVATQDGANANDND